MKEERRVEGSRGDVRSNLKIVGCGQRQEGQRVCQHSPDVIERGGREE